jgi:hypothetical protein
VVHILSYVNDVSYLLLIINTQMRRLLLCSACCLLLAQNFRATSHVFRVPVCFSPFCLYHSTYPIEMRSYGFWILNFEYVVYSTGRFALPYRRERDSAASVLRRENWVRDKIPPYVVPYPCTVLGTHRQGCRRECRCGCALRGSEGGR